MASMLNICRAANRRCACCKLRRAKTRIMPATVSVSQLCNAQLPADDNMLLVNMLLQSAQCMRLCNVLQCCKRNAATIVHKCVNAAATGKCYVKAAAAMLRRQR